ncbi:hypothetical protein FSZ31_04225 [Sphingorhabdus soli]|uniref:Uncharacterized protein n=1 Tax=Flavisphingopyxis soli TaxID=2601267 RepID=A0A5C6UN15_9SPHN|nr:hypothetical protein [Sphingorhabdus soli]TXC73934.1 hypothetical protein FSZ31_04225 [Sphingorhabdus soli]
MPAAASSLHERIAARARAADLAITPAGVAEIDRLLVEETRAAMLESMATRLHTAIEATR